MAALWVGTQTKRALAKIYPAEGSNMLPLILKRPVISWLISEVQARVGKGELGGAYLRGGNDWKGFTFHIIAALLMNTKLSA
ncbi:hypothetical protein [Phyllobacterium myrsinacearum]|uniref:hypothetical protein n=1 Tax=Phyllobacterium myrsinacearum TaxID=28101 RepID=UPI00102AE396|nr:hypothetical protein [Phyllobacterium myrsinacearum]